MTDPGFKPQNFRIFRRVTAARIIALEDALTFGKIRWNLVEYRKGNGAQTDVVHYMDWQRAAFLAWDLLHHDPLADPPTAWSSHPVWWNGYLEYKGTRKDGALEARTFTIEIVDAKNPVKITVTNGPGEPVGNDGAIKPAKGEEQSRVSVLLPWTIAREMALVLHTHLQAWQTMTYYQRLQAGTWQPPDDADTRVVDPTTGEILPTQANTAYSGFGKATGAPKEEPQHQPEEDPPPRSVAFP